MHVLHRSHIEIVACIFSLIVLVFSIDNCFRRIADIEHKAVSPNEPQHLAVGIDMRYYINAGTRYQLTGQLYERSDDYGPLAPLYKFPPAFQLQLLPFTTSHNPEKFIKPLRIAMIAGYFSACLALMLYIGKAMKRHNQPNVRIVLFLSIAAITATSSIGFYDCIFITNYEIPIFSLLTAAFFILPKYPRLSAIIIGYLACAKLYPAPLAGMLLAKFGKKTIATFVISCIFFVTTGLIIFGLKENIFFFWHIIPEIFSEKIFVHLYNKSLGVGIFRLTQDTELANNVFQACRVAFLGGTVFIMAAYHSKLSTLRLEVFAILMALTLICLPNYWLCYLVLLFPALCIVIRRIVILPCSATNIMGLACLACMITYMQDWLHFGAPQWLHSLANSDETGTSILAAAEKGNITMALLMFAFHYPWYTLILLLEKVIFFVPAILWILTAREIISPTLPQKPQ